MIIIKQKECSVCKEVKDLSDFYSYKKVSKSRGEYVYHPPYCKSCAIEMAKAKTTEEIKRKREVNQKLYNKKKNIRLAQMREYREENKDDWYEYYSNYLNRDYVKGNLKSYRFERMNKNHNITEIEWQDCKDYFNNKCAYCGLDADNHYVIYGGNPILSDLHKEHVNHNGANDLSNCVPSCKSCNSSKHTSKLDDWYSKDNDKYTVDRYTKIQKWLNEEYKKYIQRELVNKYNYNKEEKR